MDIVLLKALAILAVCAILWASLKWWQKRQSST